MQHLTTSISSYSLWDAVAASAYSGGGTAISFPNGVEVEVDMGDFDYGPAAYVHSNEGLVADVGLLVTVNEVEPYGDGDPLADALAEVGVLVED